MSSDPEVFKFLGQIDGKLDQLIDAAKEHRDDDKRRFTEVYVRLDEHSSEINKAKGAKGALLWVAGGIAGVVGFVATFAAKTLGWH